MPQIRPGWIPIAAILLSGMGAGSTVAGLLNRSLGSDPIAKRDVVACLMLFALMVVAGFLL